MYLEIVTPDKSIYSGEISSVQLPGVDGSFEILNNHAPIVSILEKGRIKVCTITDNEQIFYEIDGGVIEMTNNKIIVLAEMFH